MRDGEPAGALTATARRRLGDVRFSWVARRVDGDVCTLELVPDDTTWDEVLASRPDDAETLRALIAALGSATFDVDTGALTFGTGSI